MTRDRIVTFCFIALLLFVVYQIFLVFSPFVNSIFWAAMLSFGFYPFYKKFKRPFKKRESLAALAMTVLIIMIVTPPMVIIIANIATQAVELYQFATTYIREGHLENFIDQIRSRPIVDKLRANTYLEWEQIKENLTNWLLAASRMITNFSVSQVGAFTKNIFIITINLIFTGFLTFIFLKDGQKIYEFIYQVTPLKDKSKKAVFDQVNGSFSAVIRGQILTSLVQAALIGLIFWILGLPLPIFFAIATFITSLIPLIGAAGVWVPYAVFLAIQSFPWAVDNVPWKLIILIIFGTFVSFVDNILKPAVIGEKTKLPYFLLFFGILGGLKVYGIMGVFLAPAILSLFFALVKIYQEEFS